jgi:polyhydroxyalkanoate synthesis regulator phasin
MLKLLKKGYLIGLGLASLTREKVEELVDELVRRGEIAEKDRPGAIEDLLNRVKEEQKKLSKTVKATAQKVIAETGIPTRQQFEELIKRLEKLEQATHSRKKPD